MYLRAIRCHMREGVDPARVAEIYQEMLPAISAHPGYLGASLMMNETARMAVAFVYWDSREQATSAGETLRPMLFKHTWELTDDCLDITGYQVLHHTMANL